MLRGSSFRTGHYRSRKIQDIKANQYFRERFSTAKEQQIRTSRLIAIATCHAFHNTHQSNGFVASDVSSPREHNWSHTEDTVPVNNGVSPRG